MTAPQAVTGGNTPLTYPTLSNFLDMMNFDAWVLTNPYGRSPDDGPDYFYDTVGAVEQMLLLLLTRWQLEDEGDTDNQLPEVHADMAELNKLATDAERDLVMAHLVAWAQSDEGWLADYILRIGKLS